MKIALSDRDLNLASREEYLTSLEEKIMKLPLSEVSKKFFSIETPFLPIPKGPPVDKSLLYQILDKGIIWNKAFSTPSSWTNDASLWVRTFSDEKEEGVELESEVHRYLYKNKITGGDVGLIFEEVNQYLDGFYFRFYAGSDRYLFYFCSTAYNNSMKEQLEKIHSS